MPTPYSQRSVSHAFPKVAWAQLASIAIFAFLALHALTIVTIGDNAKAGSYLFLIAAPLVAAAACAGRARQERNYQGWTELGLALLLWATGMAINMSVDLMLARPLDVPGISMLFYVLYGVPLIFAVASPAHEQGHIRIIDGVLALTLGALFWLHTFSFAAFDQASAEGVLAIRWLFDVENCFIAMFALVRWQASSNPQRRSFFAILTGFAILYGIVAAYINHLASEIDFGNLPDLAIALPFLWLAWAVRPGRKQRTPLWRPASRFSLAVRAGSPLMLPATLLIVACTLIYRAPQVAAAGFVVGTLGYGLRNVLAQMRGIAEQDRLNRLSHLDALTGLPNRRQFDTTLQREWARARRLNNAFAILIIDIDHFKLLNDKFGHLVGDERLRDVAQELSSCLVRGDDFVARYGGEEFVAILSGATETSAIAMAEKMRKAVLARALPTAAPGGIVTVSIGLAWVATPSADPADLMVSKADAALYRAKNQGRNRVEHRPQ
ncbi:diguanylate cyclase [Hephaestia sp. GCM10023244]|uniref:GGDEF domain-containing protein n=1 Tax=unclassified Hephaestia TaxID=2631281 RepID=UPI0020775090|nr:GGDEF domain-containing protein [Hephaestia sp. MAHUQ-44]MCM8730736.1 GGDEF domain-containing protein [Hephaestia sp. MAHUQ-44]